LRLSLSEKALTFSEFQARIWNQIRHLKESGMNFTGVRPMGEEEDEKKIIL